MPDPLFARLSEETEKLTWPAVTEVQRRGRQRARRQSAVLACALAVVMGLGGVAFADYRNAAPGPSTALRTTEPTWDPGSSPVPSASPQISSGATTSPTVKQPSAASPAVAAGAMLQDADLPARFKLRGSDIGGDWSFAFSSSSCQDGRLYQLKKLASRGQAFDGDVDESLLQRTERYASADAARYLDLVRARVESCPSSPWKLTVVDQGFAGQESLLIQVDYGGGATALHIFVRQGDLVTEFWQKRLTDRTEARRLADRAARRLCAGTDAC